MSHFAKSAKGATLAVSLIMLLVLTLLGVTAMQTVSFEEKMSSNSVDGERAFQSSESAINQAENWVMTLTGQPVPVSSCSSQPCVIEYQPTVYFEDQTSSWWTSNSAAFTGTPLANISTQPRYIIEFYRFVPDDPTIGQGTPTGVYYYQVTGRGSGTTDNAVSILQTTVARRY